MSSNSHQRRMDPLHWSAFCLAGILGLAMNLVPRGAIAQPGPQARPEAAQRYIQAAHAELLRGQAALAVESFEKAYTLSPLADIFYYLGQAAEKTRPVDALDYYQRFLNSDSAAKQDPEIVRRINAFRSTAPKPYSEVTFEFDASLRGAILTIDNRLRGTLGQTGAVLLPQGAHQISVLSGNSRLSSPSRQFPAGQSTVVLSLGPQGQLLVASTASVLVWLAYTGRWSEPLQSAVTAAVASRLATLHFAMITPSAKAFSMLPSPPGSCLRADLADAIPQVRSAERFLLVQIESSSCSPPDQVQVAAYVYDVALRALGATGKAACTTAQGQSADSIGDMVRELARQTVNRDRGRIDVTSNPDRAKILLDKCQWGLTPVSGIATFAGEHELALQRRGYALYTTQVQVPDGETASVEVALVRGAALPRPLWRLAVGSVLIGAGFVVSGFGAWGLVTNGHCANAAQDPMTCDPYYNTATVGGALLGVGAAVAVGGVLLMAIPGGSR